MGQSADAYLFYGYTLPDDYEIPAAADETYLRDNVPVRIGRCGYENATPYVEITAVAARAWDYGTAVIDPAALLAALPADADGQLRAFATEHGLLLPEQRDGDEKYDPTAGPIGWHIAAHYG